MNDEVIILDSSYSEGRFASSPFDNNPPWLSIALQRGYMAVIPLPEKKYGKYKAVWAVKKDDGTIQVAEPGDRINNDMMFGLIVTKKRTNIMNWDSIKPEED